MDLALSVGKFAAELVDLLNFVVNNRTLCLS
jgi:hypothetical protein